MRKLQETYVIKDLKTPDVYLAGTYIGDPRDKWCITAREYIKEAIKQIEGRLNIKLREEKTLIKMNDHPVEDESPVLDNDMHREYQLIMGMLQWAVSLYRIDICFAVYSLSRFCACLHQEHMTRVLCIWGYLKKYPCRALNIVSDKFIIQEEELDYKFIDFMEQYQYSKEEIDPRFPKPMSNELDVSIFFDSDHAHDKVTGLLMSVVIVMVGSTPITWKSKRQGAVQTSTYGAEFSVMRLAMEGAITIHYMLRALGINVSKPSMTSGDNAGVIANASTPDAMLKKKNM